MNISLLVSALATVVVVSHAIDFRTHRDGEPPGGPGGHFGQSGYLGLEDNDSSGNNNDGGYVGPVRHVPGRLLNIRGGNTNSISINNRDGTPAAYCTGRCILRGGSYECDICEDGSWGVCTLVDWRNDPQCCCYPIVPYDWPRCYSHYDCYALYCPTWDIPLTLECDYVGDLRRSVCACVNQNGYGNLQVVRPWPRWTDNRGGNTNTISIHNRNVY